MGLENDLTQMNIFYRKEIDELKARLLKIENKLARLEQFSPMEDDKY